MPRMRRPLAPSAQQSTLEAPLLTGDLQGRQQHQHPRRQGQQRHQLHHRGALVDDGAHDPQHAGDVNGRHAGVAADDVGENVTVLFRQMEAGQPGTRQVVEGARGGQHEEVDVKALPADFAQVGHLGGDTAATGGERQAVAKLDTKALGKIGLHRQLGRRILHVTPPLAGHHAVVGGQLLGPGQVELPPRQSTGLRAVVLLGLKRLIVELVSRARTMG